ncbi:MAG: CheR family methyltransferase [Hydrogenobaculum sp.]
MEQKTVIDGKILEELRKIIYELTGNYYPDERLMLLAKKLNMFLEEGKPEESLKVKLDELFKEKKLTKDILNIITVPETKFFREKLQLDTFMKEIVLKIIFPSVPKGQPVKVASFACATGEEVYTLAMMFEANAVPYQIIGFDINESYLEKARTGIYPKREMLDIPQEYHKFLDIKEDSFKIKDSIMKKTQFKQLNLIKKEDFAPYKELFDAAFCRNALIYFDDNSKLSAIRNIAYTIKIGGFFTVSMTEVLSRIHTQFFETVKINNIFFYKKIK